MLDAILPPCLHSPVLRVAFACISSGTDMFTFRLTRCNLCHCSSLFLQRKMYMTSMRAFFSYMAIYHSFPISIMYRQCLTMVLQNPDSSRSKQTWQSGAVSDDRVHTTRWRNRPTLRKDMFGSVAQKSCFACIAFAKARQIRPSNQHALAPYCSASYDWSSLAAFGI